MVESFSDFPFSKMRYYKYLMLNVMMYVEHQQVLQFMFTCNKQARTFLQHNYIIVRNGFVNDGLIPYFFDGVLSETQFHDYNQIEKLYFQALTRNIENRVLTISIKANLNFSTFYEVVKWIKAQ
jgi:hypothetical protein